MKSWVMSWEKVEIMRFFESLKLSRFLDFDLVWISEMDRNIGFHPPNLWDIRLFINVQMLGN